MATVFALFHATSALSRMVLRACHTVMIFVQLAAIFVATEYEPMTMASLVISPMLFFNHGTITARACTSADAPVMVYFTTGMSCSPSSMLRSLKCFLALSSSACALSLARLNSSKTDCPVAYAALAVFSAFTTSPSLLASTESTCTARLPDNPIWSNIGASLSNPPFPFIVAKNWSRAWLASVFSMVVNFFTSTPASCANFAGSLNMAVISWLSEVADTSTSCMFWSRTEPKLIICGIVIPACLATPAIRAANSTR